MIGLAWLIPLFPAVGAIINGCFGSRTRDKAGLIASAMAGLSFLVVLVIAAEMIFGAGKGGTVTLWPAFDARLFVVTPEGAALERASAHYLRSSYGWMVERGSRDGTVRLELDRLLFVVPPSGGVPTATVIVRAAGYRDRTVTIDAHDAAAWAEGKRVVLTRE